jgi:hypothetical protein
MSQEQLADVESDALDALDVLPMDVGDGDTDLMILK